MVALEALIGLHEPVPGESIDEHWQRLLTMRFKLTVLRSSDMPPDQRDLWKHLWSCCFAGIDSIGEQLRTAIFGFKDLNSSSAAQCGKELQSELVSAAIAEALDEHLHLDKQLSEFNTRVRHNFERLVGEGGAAVTSKQRLDDSAVSAAPCSFARPVDRREKFESFLDSQFAQDGVAAINMIVERRLSSAKARRRPSSTGLSTSIIQSQPSRSSSSLFSGSAPNGYALQQRVFTSQTPSRASPNYPAELRVSSAAIVQRKK
jgi:hypothetical protein